MTNSVLRILFFVAMITISTSVVANTVNDSIEFVVLKKIYTTMNGSSWNTKTNWPTSWPSNASSATFGTWYGVSVSNGDVVGIDLGMNNVTGSIPSEIGLLTELVTLKFNDNTLSGSIPTTIGDLTKLQTLNCLASHLTGSIPTEISGCTSLKEIQLSYNSISGSIPSGIASLAALEKLSLQHNSFSGSVPDLSDLSSLQYLILSENQFTSITSASIGSLSALKELVLDINQISGSLPSDIGNLTNLTKLTALASQMSGSLPSSIGSLSSLVELNLAYNAFSGSIPTSIGNLDNLVLLDIRDNDLSGAIPTEIGNMGAIQSINLSNNDLTLLPSSITQLTTLKSLSIENNQVTGSLPTNLGSMTALETLALLNNQLSGSIPASIGSLTHLSSLSLSYNSLTGTIPSGLGGIASLTRIDVRHNQLTGTFPSLAGTALASFNIGENSFTAIPTLPSTVTDIYATTNKISFTTILSTKAALPSAIFSYDNQGPVDEVKTVKAQVAGTLNLTTSIDRSTSPASVYRWFKKVSGVDTPLNTASTSGHTVQVTNIQQSDEGTQYFYTITNSGASSLTITSNLQTLDVIVCDIPEVSFATAVDAYTYTFTPTVTNAGSCTTSYLWDFGDGQTSPDATSSHVFNTTGTYLVSLTLSYKCGECDSTAVVVQDTVEVSNTSICTAIFCDGYGNVGIGTMRTQGFRLSVDGKIRASEIIKVYPQGQWSDFVFEDKYRLRPLSEVEKFIKTNGHLPDIPSAKEVEKEGVELGSMDAKLLQKIEELTLYVIKLEKEVEKLKTEKK